jgi:3-isopropylmalate/(R)-2-methylmalate dehydratase large subunit
VTKEKELKEERRVLPEKDKPTVIEGRIWLIPRDNIDTDMIFHNRYLAITELNEMGQFAFNNLKGFEDFASKSKAGDIVVSGKNFGCGSSREHPSVGLAYAGVKVVLVKSVNRIFYRSSINQGLALIVHKVAVESYRPGDFADVDFEKGQIRIGTNIYEFEPLPAKLRQIIEKKGLVNYMKTT